MTPNTWTVIEANRVFDGIHRHVRDGVRIVVEGDTIRAIGRPDEITTPTGPDVQFLRTSPTSTLLPGLIDTHIHLTMNGSGVPLPPAAEQNDGVLLMQAVTSARAHLLDPG